MLGDDSVQSMQPRTRFTSDMQKQIRVQRELVESVEELIKTTYYHVESSARRASQEFHSAFLINGSRKRAEIGAMNRLFC